MTTTESAKVTESPEQIILARGVATLAELGIDARRAIDLAKKTPSIEPVFLVKFRSRQGKTRVEEIRAYAWPSQRIALAHMGYVADDARLLRLETRQPAEFPGRLYARFEKDPKKLEELRTTAKLYERAMKQAPSKPGRAERDVLPLVNAFKKLGSDVAIEMLIDTAAAFQRIDNATYASKMLGNLLKLVQKDKSVDVSLLARTVLAAADDGVFNASLYEHSWQSIAKKNGVKTALGFGLRVFRRLMTGGRAIPTDFTKVLRKAAALGKVTDFEAIFDSTIVWAAGVSSFWNTSRKTASWRDAATADHNETQLLRARLRELWMRAEGEQGAAWKREIWGRVQASMPELTSYGRMVLTENQLAVTESSAMTREDGERLLEGALAMLVKPPRNADRARVETAGSLALFRLASMLPDMLWEKTAPLEDALRTATGDLTSYVALYDLLSDVSEALGEREQRSLLQSIPGLEAAFCGALVSALSKTEREVNPDDDDDDYYDDDNEDAPPVVTLLGEALTILTPESAPAALADLGTLAASRLSKDLTVAGASAAWGRVLGTLHALGPIGAGIASEATRRFLVANGRTEKIAMAAPVAQSLDGDALRAAAESRHVVSEVLEMALSKATPLVEKLAVLRPTKEVKHDSPQLVEVVQLDDKSYRALWTDNEDVDDAKAFAVTSISSDGRTQAVVMSGPMKGLRAIRLWASDRGFRLMTVKDRAVALFDENNKPVGKLTLPEDLGGSWGLAVHLERYHALFEKSEEVVVVSSSLAPVVEASGKGWGRWWILESPDGKAPPIVVHQGDPLNALYVEGKRVPPPKLGDLRSLLTLARAADGTFWMDYRSKKTNIIKRATWDAASSSWRSGPATLPDEANPVTDFGGFAEFTEQRRTIDRRRRGWAFEDDERLIIKDVLGVDLAAAPGQVEGTAHALDLESGVVIYPDVIYIDESLSTRIDAARDLRAAIIEEPGDPLSRELYSDRDGLARHVRNALESREAGRRALETLGRHADEILRASVDEVLPRLKARLAILDALEAPSAPQHRVPQRKPGVSRTELRRLVRTRVKGTVAGFVFWALDGDDAHPVLEYLRSNAKESMPLAFTLLGLAQNPKTDKALAERLLNLAEAIAESSADQGREVEIATTSHDWIEDDDDLARGKRVSVLTVSDSESLQTRPSHKYAKNEAPLEWSEDVAKRSEDVLAWLVKEWGGVSASVVGKNDDTGRVFRVPLRSSNGKLAIDVSVVWNKKDGFRWELTEISGKTTMGELEAALVELEATVVRLSGAPCRLIPGRGVMRSDVIDMLKRGVALTRSRLHAREALGALSWSAPAVPGAEDPKSRLWIMLTWIFGALHHDAVGSTYKAFKALAAKCKLVNGGWYGLTPAVPGAKKRDEYDEPDGSDGAPEIAELRAKTFAKLDSDRSLDAYVILEDPSVVIAAYEKAIAAVPKPMAPKKRSAR